MFSFLFPLEFDQFPVSSRKTDSKSNTLSDSIRVQCFSGQFVIKEYFVYYIYIYCVDKTCDIRY